MTLVCRTGCFNPYELIERAFYSSQARDSISAAGETCVYTSLPLCRRIRHIIDPLFSKPELEPLRFLTDDFMEKLQHASLSLLPHELNYLLLLRKTEFVARMNYLATRGQEPGSLWSLTSRPLAMISFSVLAYSALREESDFYVKVNFVGQGRVKIVTLLKQWPLRVGHDQAIAFAEPIDQKSSELFHREVEIVERLRIHAISGIVDMTPVRYYRELKTPCLQAALMEYCEGGTLFEYLRSRPPLLEKTDILISITETLLKMEEEADMCHLDLKLNNICVTKKKGVVYPRLIDFGAARSIGDMTPVCSTFPPPEMISSPGGICVKPSLDYWAMARLIWYLILEGEDRGKAPFYVANLTYEDYDFDLHLQQLRREMDASLDEPWRGIMLALLSPHPEKRPSFRTLWEILTRWREKLTVTSRDQ